MANSTDPKSSSGDASGIEASVKENKRDAAKASEKNAAKELADEDEDDEDDEDFVRFPFPPFPLFFTSLNCEGS